jgi:hypothetical protein
LNGWRDSTVSMPQCQNWRWREPVCRPIEPTSISSPAALVDHPKRIGHAGVAADLAQEQRHHRRRSSAASWWWCQCWIACAVSVGRNHAHAGAGARPPPFKNLTKLKRER